MTNENEKPKEETGKKNYCDTAGNCTCENYPDELDCSFCKRGVLSGICCYRVYFADRCLSPFALVVAREVAPKVNNQPVWKEAEANG
jgi:hypothetical protein